MRAFLTLILPSVVLAALTAWLVARCPGTMHGSGCAAEARPACGTVAQLDRTLHLSSEQKRAAAGELDAYGRELAACDARLAETRERMAQQLFQPGVADERLQGMADELSRIQRDSDLATLRHMRRMHALLTPEQQARYTAWLQPCVCGNQKPAGDGACCCVTTNRP